MPSERAPSGEESARARVKVEKERAGRETGRGEERMGVDKLGKGGKAGRRTQS